MNKRGYISLLGGGTKLIGDSAAMLAARDAVLDSGAFAALSDTVASAARGSRILDAGAGTGHYLRSVLTALPDARGLALDLSPAAAARAIRSSERIDGVVADTWRPLPVRTAVADTVLDVFAPRNLPEFHRVLRPSGTLLVVVPRPDHLAELRVAGAMLNIPGDKADEVVAAATDLFALDTREHVRATLELDDRLRHALVAMGPSAHHASQTAPAVASATLSIDLVRLTAR